MAGGIRVFRGAKENLLGGIGGMVIFGWLASVAFFHCIDRAAVDQESVLMNPFGVGALGRAPLLLIGIVWLVPFLVCLWLVVAWARVTIETDDTGITAYDVFRNIDFSAGWHELDRLELRRSLFGGDRYTLCAASKRLKLHYVFGSATGVTLEVKRRAPHLMTLRT